jgi:hypothetical protein
MRRSQNETGYCSSVAPWSANSSRSQSESEACDNRYAHDSEWRTPDPLCSHLSGFEFPSRGSAKARNRIWQASDHARSQKAHVNGKIFAEYVKSEFLPYVAKPRSEREIEQAEVVL